MDFYKDNRFLVFFALFVILAVALLIYPVYSGLILISGLLLFGGLALIWKDPNIRIAGMVLLVLLSLTSIYFDGMKFGIDFIGGTRIPITLDQSATPTQMSDLVQTIQTRVSVMGLTETQVEAVGDSEIYVEIPAGNNDSIQFIEQTLSKQGVYQGIIDGKVAITGDDIFPSSIGPADPASLASSGASWGVEFQVDKQGALQFANVSKGKVDYPIYMYLDRPTDAVIFYSNDQLQSIVSNYLAQNPTDDLSQRELLESLREALSSDTGNISVYVSDDLNDSVQPMDNHTVAFISANASPTLIANLSSRGFTVVTLNDSDMDPDLVRSEGGTLLVNQLSGVGLLSAPTLAPELTNGLPSYNYQITGGVTPATDANTAALEAQDQETQIESVLKGGALPIPISLGSSTTLPASLGTQFLNFSFIGIGISLVLISLLIGLRYRNLTATAPIVLISLGEFIILLAILGSFTIDLAAMAGIIAAIGVGVDAQIVITDELLKKDDQHTTHEKVDLAFGIIRTNAIIAIFSLLPLLFSGLVDIIGFSISTILGALLGYLLTRPTYAALVEKTIEAEKKAAASKNTNTPTQP